jgi:glycosyltransferase involved in cell wall biosynthesis
MKTKVLVRAPVLTQSGYGEHGRFVLRALRSREDLFDIYLVNINWGRTSWLWEDNEERQWYDELIHKTFHYAQGGGNFDISIQVTIPNEWEKMAPVNIGVTAGIEATQVAPQWIEKSFLVDKIITISQHSKETFERTSYSAQNKETGQTIDDFRTTVPIEIVHYPVKPVEPSGVEIELETDFNFLAVAQWGERKNMENTIKWFVEEFIDQEVGLVLKMNTMKNCLYDRMHTEKKLREALHKYPQRKCKVYLLHGSLTEGEMASLYTHDKIKALVTLTHGEGFGLPIFEAAYYGVPVIAPAWSGHVDFLYMALESKKGKVKQKPMFSTVDYHLTGVPEAAVWDGVLVKESKWCEPEQGSYKMRLREMYKDYNRFRSRAATLKEHLCANFTQEDQYKKFVDLIGPLPGVDGDEVDRLFAELAAP